MKHLYLHEDVHVVRSLDLAWEIGTNERKPWSNAYRAQQALLPQVSLYVEGWVVSEGGVAIAHAWLQWGERILDPTPGMAQDRSVAYFPGLRLTPDQLLACLAARAALPVVEHLGRGGLNHPGYLRAFATATEYSTIGMDRTAALVLFRQAMAARARADELEDVQNSPDRRTHATDRT